MGRRFAAPALLLLLAGLCGPAAGQQGQTRAAAARASLTVHVDNLSSRGGVLRMGLYDARSYPHDGTPLASADVPVTGVSMSVTLGDLPPGRYALELFQDINANGHMDSELLGLPSEPFGFSHDARPLFSKPSFASVSFLLHEGANSQSVHLQSWMGGHSRR